MKFVLFFIFFPSLLLASGLSERVQKTYADTQDYQSQFVQTTHIEILNRDVKENGKMFFSKPGRFLIHYEGAHERKYICDGSTLWVVHPRDKAVEVFKEMKDIKIPRIPAKINQVYDEEKNTKKIQKIKIQGKTLKG